MTFYGFSVKTHLLPIALMSWDTDACSPDMLPCSRIGLQARSSSLLAISRRKVIKVLGRGGCAEWGFDAAYYRTAWCPAFSRRDDRRTYGDEVVFLVLLFVLRCSIGQEWGQSIKLSLLSSIFFYVAIFSGVVLVIPRSFSAGFPP